MQREDRTALSKKDLTRDLIRRNPSLLICPMCGGELLPTDSYALVCPDKHSFDISRQGYVNLLASPVKPDYGAELFEARWRVCRSGFFDGLLDELRGIVIQTIPSEQHGRTVLLDAGCGEGSHLARLTAGIGSDISKRIIGVGADISKDGVRIAAREYPGLLWCVADLARLPLADHSVDVVLNILSPANYAEFRRVLKPGGTLVKAVPGGGYLSELRQEFHPEKQNEYSGERVKKLFKESFPLAETRHVLYTVNVEGETLRDLVDMTPLSWHVPEASRKAVIDRGSMDITAEFDILIARNPHPHPPT